MAEETAVAEIKKLGEGIEKVLGKAEAATATAKKAEDAVIEVKSLLSQLESSAKVISDWKADKEEADRKNQEALNSLIAETKAMREGNQRNAVKGISFGESFAELIKENYNDIKKTSRGQKLSIDMKAATSMTTTGDITGSPNITYVPKPALIPAQKVNFRDLVSTFQSQTGLINLFRETGVQGSIGQQLTEGTSKNQIEYQYTNVSFQANYIAGYVRVSKQMLNDLLFLQTYLPQQLLRDFYKVENATFLAALVAAATGSTTTSGGNTAEKLIDYITNIEGTNFGVNGIVIPPALWGSILKTKLPSTGTSYSVPGGFSINPATGNVEIAGVPIIKATWPSSGNALVGDWSMASIAAVDNLKVEFFEQDSDNVERNLITVRVEAREVLVIERPDAFVVATGLT